MAPWHISSSIATKFQRLYPYIYGVNLSGSGTVDVMGRRCVLKIEDGSQLTGSTNNFAGFADIHLVPKTIHGFTTIYETSESPPIMTDSTSYRKSKMTAN